MFETLAYEIDRNRRGSLVLTFVVSLYGVFAVGLFPTFTTAGIDLEVLVQSYPEAIREAFGIEALGTIEGFLAGELYSFVWLLLLGVYFAYRAAGMIPSDIEHERLGLVLTLPLSRTTVLIERFVSLLFPIVVLNVGAGVVVFASALVISEPIDPVALAMVHLLSIPYLLACSAIGLVLSVLVDRADIAERAAIGVVFTLYLVESLAASTDGFEALQYVSPTRYYNPTDILVHETYALDEVGVLLGVIIVLFIVSRTLFLRRDI